MADCPTCEYHKQRAKIWRDEAYKLAGHPLPRKETSMTEEDDDIQDYKKPWVGLTEEKVDEIYTSVQEEVNEHWDKGGTTMMFPITLYKAIEQALKERNA